MNESSPSPLPPITPTTTVTFLGTAAVTPGPNHDTASLLINDRYLVDTGWRSALRMRDFGFDPLALQYLFLTHCHHDHYLGLPMLLFYRALNAPTAPPLTILGPQEDVERIVNLSLAFLQSDRYPELNAAASVLILPLSPGDHYETDAFLLETCAAVHTVPALCYRFTDRATGAVVAVTGDTAYAPHIAAFVRDAALLVTEASYGPNPAPADNRWGHQGAPEAAQLAAEASVRLLALVHCREPQQQEALAVAQRIFPNAFWPTDGETVSIGPDNIPRRSLG